MSVFFRINGLKRNDIFFQKPTFITGLFAMAAHDRKKYILMKNNCNNLLIVQPLGEYENVDFVFINYHNMTE